MSVYYLDSSALVKRYVSEAGTRWLRQLTNPIVGETIVVSALTVVELRSALARRQREGALPPDTRVRLQNHFLRHVDTLYSVAAIDDSVLRLAGRLVEAHPLRTLDAIQLASALEAQATLGVNLTFVSADRRLLAVATAEGLLTDDPNRHP